MSAHVLEAQEDCVPQTYSEIKGDFGILSLNEGEEAGFLAGAEFVCQRRTVHFANSQSQQAEKYRERPHGYRESGVACDTESQKSINIHGTTTERGHSFAGSTKSWHA